LFFCATAQRGSRQKNTEILKCCGKQTGRFLPKNLGREGEAGLCQATYLPSLCFFHGLQIISTNSFPGNSNLNHFCKNLLVKILISTPISDYHVVCRAIPAKIRDFFSGEKTEKKTTDVCEI
jgi:hypothetical protein